MAKKTKKDEKLVIDFGGSVLYDAFRKIIDYFYLDDLSVLDNIADSTEMMEIIKLSKQYNLDTLFKAAERHFQEIMYQWFEISPFFALKKQSSYAVGSNITAPGNFSTNIKRSKESEQR